MKIAIAADGNTIDASISPMGGRAPYYLIFEEKKLTEIIKNPFAVGGGGAGWSVAHILVDKGVNLVIVGQIGPNMATALTEKGIKVTTATGLIKDALNKI